MQLDILKKLFVHRNDVYSIQTPEGGYRTIKMPVTDEVLKSHIDGKQTIGLYHLDTNDTVKCACIDIDVNKSSWSKPDFDYSINWAPIVDGQVREVKRRLTKYGIVGYEEFSGFKGSHVWYFFEHAVPASTAKDLNDVMFGDMKAVNSELHFELFPKQNSTNGGLGNLIKMPLGMHRKTNSFSYFKDPILSEISYVTQEVIEKIISPLDSVFINCQVMNDLRSQAQAGHLSHTGRLALAYILLNLGKTGETSLVDILSKTNDYEEKKTKYNIDKIKDKGYKPITCQKLQSSEMDHMCPGQCPNIRSGKSPIAFYYRHTGKMSPTHMGQATDSVDDFLSKVDMIKKDGTYYLYKPGKSEIWQLLSNFIVDIHTQVTRDDGINVNTSLKGNIVQGEDTIPFEIDAKHMASPDRLREAIYNALGNQALYCENYTFLQHAINKFTVSEKMLVREVFGYDDNFERYMTPSTIITASGAEKNNEVYIDLSSKELAQYLDIKTLDDNEYLKLHKHINDDLLTLTDFGLSHSMLGHTMSPIIEPWLYGEDPTRYVLFIKGASGEGKSFLAKVMSHFYSPNMITYENWGDTSNRITRAGYDFKDALYLVDDWKRSNIKDMGGALGVLQSYADRSSRGRLNKDATLQKTMPIRGVLVITGEDIAEGQSSVLARTITLNYEQPRKDLLKGGRVLKNKKDYSAVTGRYISYILGMQNKEEHFQEFRIKQHAEFYDRIIGEHNDIRIARNYSLLLTSYHFFANWFWDAATAKRNEEELKNYFFTNMSYVVNVSADQRPAETFWETLNDLLAIGKLRIQTSASVDTSDAPKNIPIIGFYGSNTVHILMKVALNEVEKYLKSSGESLAFSKTTIIEDLHKAGFLKNSKPMRKKLNNQMVHTFEVDPVNIRKE
jgi:L-rhamnose mutarotase